MGKTNVPNARERILQAAVRVFAEKSFEGARIDEIAKEANVPKSLIYYHFKSKDEMLDVLLGEFITSYEALLRSGSDGVNHGNGDAVKQRMNHYYSFAMANADLIRVMFMESLKKSAEKPIMYRVVEVLVDSEAEPAADDASSDKDRKERMVGEFFNGVLPLFGYICFADSWTRSYDMDRAMFDKLFMDVFSAAHSGYHLARGGQHQS
ncbi:TetR/AcrR family transcriptional regulator [Paenibacillus sp. PR3]|uniref:TetR/AcrR family transcriptional regulator n=1 Tax=Paenibacillus terricola TaxID=2763503 RepID=A0ABR8MTS2_9BACL|nr:TetR/AcrR family transcriptional regulator [Paenibacillus terricola]MBD3917924.1 TetR/AcrR family transcriptional regulator [Paenibacillus terricola]